MDIDKLQICENGRDKKGMISLARFELTPSIPEDIVRFICLVICKISISSVGDINIEQILSVGKKDVKCLSVQPTFDEIFLPILPKIRLQFPFHRTYFVIFTIKDGRVCCEVLPSN